MKRFSAVAALCLPLFACVGAEPEWPGFLRARASLEVPVGATRAGAAPERRRDARRADRDRRDRRLVERHQAGVDTKERWRIEGTYPDITGERRSVVLPVQ